jgi:hypothetical protein
MTYLGIDPGQSGGIAVIWPAGDASAWKMPETEDDLIEVLQDLKSGHNENELFAVLEKVHAMPKQGVSSVFTFGQNYGGLRMALAALKIRREHVTPQKWQKEMGCMTRGDKNVSKRRAQELFPKIKVIHAIADALLIAEYARRTYK